MLWFALHSPRAPRSPSRAARPVARVGKWLVLTVLAAGASIRFGSATKLVRVAGRPLLHTRRDPGREVTGTLLIVGWVRGCGARPLFETLPVSIVVDHDGRELARQLRFVRAALSRGPGESTSGVNAASSA